MHIEHFKDGSPYVHYDSWQEEDAAIRNFLYGNYGALTTLELVELKEIADERHIRLPLT